MSEITGNIMADLNTENDFANEAKKMMKLYEDEQPEVICIPQDEISEESVRKFYDYSCTYANTEEEALEKAKEIVECGELDLETMELGDYGYELMFEVADEH